MEQGPQPPVLFSTLALAPGASSTISQSSLIFCLFAWDWLQVCDAELAHCACSLLHSAPGSAGASQTILFSLLSASVATCCVAGAGQVRTDVALQVIIVCEKAEGACAEACF